MVSPRTDASLAGTTAGTTSADWTVQVADTIESVARALVYGILIAVLGTTALVLGVVILVRVLSYVLEVWAVYTILGAIFTLTGMFLWRKRRPAGDPSKK